MNIGATPFTPLLDESWLVALEAQIEALPLTDADVLDAYTVGILDAEKGTPRQPHVHYAKLGDIDLYCQGFDDATETLNAAADLRDGIEDEEFYRRGC